MNRLHSRIAAGCALLALTGVAFAEDPDPSGQFAMQVHSDLTRAQETVLELAAQTWIHGPGAR